jgi:hypothetical protein
MGYKDVLVYQENCKTLGYEPFNDADMAEMKRGHDDLIQRYGGRIPGFEPVTSTVSKCRFSPLGSLTMALTWGTSWRDPMESPRDTRAATRVLGPL